MTPGSILLGFALLLIVALFLMRPFMEPSRKQQRTTRRQVLLAQKDGLLEEISLLDFDYTTGKMPDQIYQEQRAHMLAEASAVLQELEGVEGYQPSSIAQGEFVGDIDREIEAAITRFRKVPAMAKTSNGKGKFCTQCGQPADAEDRFCAHCGHKLHA